MRMANSVKGVSESKRCEREWRLTVANEEDYFLGQEDERQSEEHILLPHLWQSTT